VEVAKGTIDRSRATGQFVQTAASAVAALYTGILAFTAIGANKELPVRGLIPVVFLGLAIALSVGYLAYLGNAGTVDISSIQPSRRAHQWERTAAFVRFVNQAVLNRAELIRASVICFAFGVVFLPVGLVAIDDLAAWLITGILLAIALIPVGRWGFAQIQGNRPGTAS
jgi:hypothetical protein